MFIENSLAFQTVDPRYSSWISLVALLVKLDVIQMGSKKHSFSPMTAIRGIPKVEPHWIQMAVLSMNLEYMEIVPLPRKSCGD